MSDTPETNDALEKVSRNTWDISVRDLAVMHELSKKLERERDELRERVGVLESWIATAAPVMESACCIAIEENVSRFDEIAGCQGIIETCPVEFEKMLHVLNWRRKTKEGK
jgi:hypothetical protein